MTEILDRVTWKPPRLELEFTHRFDGKECQSAAIFHVTELNWEVLERLQGMVGTELSCDDAFKLIENA